MKLRHSWQAQRSAVVAAGGSRKPGGLQHRFEAYARQQQPLQARGPEQRNLLLLPGPSTPDEAVSGFQAAQGYYGYFGY